MDYQHLITMSIFSVQARKHTAYYDHLMSASTSRTPDRERLATQKGTNSLGKIETVSKESIEDSRSSDKSRLINRTYITSGLSKSGSGQQTPYRGRLTLQRRSRRKSGVEKAEKTMTESSQNSTPAPEKRLTLQRRTRTPSTGKSSTRGVRGVSSQQATPKILCEPNGRTPVLFRSMSLKETASKSKLPEHGASVETQERLVHSKTPSSSSSLSLSKHLDDQSQTFKTPTRKTPFEKIAAKRDVFERLANKEAPKLVAVKSTSLERPRPVPAPRVSKASAGVQNRKTNISNQKRDVTLTRISAAAPASTDQPRETVKQQESFKMENSAVTVAVRVRPFSARFVI